MIFRGYVSNSSRKKQYFVEPECFYGLLNGMNLVKVGWRKITRKNTEGLSLGDSLRTRNFPRA
ncbi:MAG: hypothetical protein ACXVB9_09440, partial [Bdellovibrionota bacterium]